MARKSQCEYLVNLGSIKYSLATWTWTNMYSCNPNYSTPVENLLFFWELTSFQLFIKNKSSKNLNSSTQLIFHVVSPNSTQNATFNLNLFDPLSIRGPFCCYDLLHHRPDTLLHAVMYLGTRWHHSASHSHKDSWFESVKKRYPSCWCSFTPAVCLYSL